MVSVYCVPLILIFTGLTILVGCLENPLLKVNADEREICDDHAGKREVTAAKKDRRLSCKVICEYDDEVEEMYYSPDGQECCDLVGGGPTGCCENGTCPVGFKNCRKT